MTFEDLGASLRAEREKRNLNIDDVANQLKISPRQLRALESGDIASLPHPAYARGFIRSYGTWLGMDSSEIQQALDSMESRPLKKTVKTHEAVASEPASRKAKKGGGIFFLILLCILAAAVWYAWDMGYLSFLQDKGKTVTGVAEKLPSADTYMAAKDASQASANRKNEDVDTTPPAQTAQENPPAAPVTVPTPITPANGRLEIEKSIASAPEQKEVDNKEEASPQAENDESAPPAQTQPGQHKLIITAIEECWVHSNADKTDTRQFSLRKGDTFALTFGESLDLKLGNAGGVRLRYDGNDLPPPGTSGQVRTLTFPPKNNQ